jgi:hypothetical protein
VQSNSFLFLFNPHIHLGCLSAPFPFIFMGGLIKWPSKSVQCLFYRTAQPILGKELAQYQQEQGSLFSIQA